MGNATTRACASLSNPDTSGQDSTLRFIFVALPSNDGQKFIAQNALPLFHPRVLDYSLSIPWEEQSVVIVPCASQPILAILRISWSGSNSTVPYNEELRSSLVSAGLEGLIPLSPQGVKPMLGGTCCSGLTVGTNIISINVVAKENSFTSRYVIRVDRRAWDPHGFPKDDIAKKLAWFRKGADAGIPIALYGLALMFHGDNHDFHNNLGYSVDDSKIEFFTCLLGAAQKGYIPAQFNLGTFYFNSEVPPRVFASDLNFQRERETAFAGGLIPGDSLNSGLSASRELMDKAKTMDFNQNDYHCQAGVWFRVAFAQGDKHSAHNLAMMYVYGHGVAVDYEQCIYWLRCAGEESGVAEMAGLFKKSAEQGDKRAARELGKMFITGVGVAKDFREALQWLLAADFSQDDAIRMILDGYIDEYRRSDDKPAAFQLARMHCAGIGVESSYVAVLEWLQRSGHKPAAAAQLCYTWFVERVEAEPEAIDALKQAALCVLDGVGADRDYVVALSLLCKSGMTEADAATFVVQRWMEFAEKETGSNRVVSQQLSRMALEGVGMEIEFKNAIHWHIRAQSSSNDPDRVVAENSAKYVFDYFLERASEGNLTYIRQVALMILDGVGTETGMDQALEWLLRLGMERPEAIAFMQARFEENHNNADNDQFHRRQAAAQLGAMFMDFNKWCQPEVAQGTTEFEFHDRAHVWLERAGSLGDAPSALQLAALYIEGDGVPIDFKLAELWYLKGGQTMAFIRQKVQKKCDTIRPMYRALFNQFSSGSPPVINIEKFRGFYISCLQAHGDSLEEAEGIANSEYQGKQKYQTIFKACDVNNDRTLSFDELWKHPHTHTSLFPKNGAHVAHAIEYFRKMQESGQLIVEEEELSVSINETKPSGHTRSKSSGFALKTSAPPESGHRRTPSSGTSLKPAAARATASSRGPVAPLSGRRPAR